MPATAIVPGLWEVSLGFVNAFILDSDHGLAVIDTGMAGSAGKILEAVRGIGREPSDVRQILVTHCHIDHAGGLAELKRQTGATVTMHRVDAEMVRAGKAVRPFKPTPGLINAFVCRFLIPTTPREVEATEVEHEVGDGETLPIAGGLQAIHVPGHCAGQLAFLWPEHGGVLIAADAVANVFGLALSPLHEDLAEGKRSAEKLAALDFRAACFGHGKPIKRGAAALFRKKWRPVPSPA